MVRSLLSMCLCTIVAMGLAGCDALNKPMVSEQPAAAPAPPPEPVKAEAGVGKQGQSLKNESGVGRMVAQPAITLFAVKQRVVFEIQIPQAMNLYEAEKGYKPRRTTSS